MGTAKNLKSKFKKTQKSKSKKSKQVRLVQDHTKFKSGINQVTRRDPTVTVTTKIGSEKLAAPPTILHMHNSNTSNGPNIGTFGPSAEIVDLIWLCILRDHSLLLAKNQLI